MGISNTQSLPHVTVVMPAYNAASTIPTAIQSVLNQSYPNKSLGIAIPAHDTKTLAVARAISDDRIQIFEQSGRGISDARNIVLRNTKPDLYMFLDADDMMKPDVMSKYVEHRLKTGMAGLRFGHYAEHSLEDTGPEWVRRAPFLGEVPRAFDRLCLLNFIGPGATMIDREIVDRVGYFDTRFHHGEDWHLWMRIAKQFPLYGLDVIAYRYTYGKLALTTPYPRVLYDDAVRALEDVHPTALIGFLSRICISAMAGLYYFRTFSKRRTLKEFLDIRTTDILSLLPAAIIRFLRKYSIV